MEIVFQEATKPVTAFNLLEVEHFVIFRCVATGQVGTFNAAADAVSDEQFLSREFFDPHDLVQVKYEMSVTRTVSQCVQVPECRIFFVQTSWSSQRLKTTTVVWLWAGRPNASW